MPGVPGIFLESTNLKSIECYVFSVIRLLRGSNQSKQSEIRTLLSNDGNSGFRLGKGGGGGLGLQAHDFLTR